MFDDPNLVSCAGLAPVFALGQRCGLAWLVADKLTVANTGGVNAAVKVPALVAGTVAGADWFYDRYFPYYGDFARLDGNDNDGIVCESCRSSTPTPHAAQSGRGPGGGERSHRHRTRVGRVVRYRQQRATAGPVEVSRVVGLDSETGEETRQVLRMQPAQRGAHYQPGKGSGAGSPVSEGATQRDGDRHDRNRRH
ncbi:MAG: hypothetical protein M3P93_02705 [Actinomycetota bacterium]|nr:hypothetical protein [Actinomycetota bacterium]